MMMKSRVANTKTAIAMTTGYLNNCAFDRQEWIA